MNEPYLLDGLLNNHKSQLYLLNVSFNESKRQKLTDNSLTNYNIYNNELRKRKRQSTETLINNYKKKLNINNHMN